MADILAVGIATLDIINSVSHYPDEDEEMRADAQCVVRGGNSTNTLEVLSQLGHQCSWAGVLADDTDARTIRASLEACNISLPKEFIHDGHSPVSYILQNRQNGSRTIVHYRDLPELSYKEFSCLSLKPYEWIHFEGRNPDAVKQMLKHARELSDATISLEIEKARENIEQLIPYADVILFSRDYALKKSWKDAVSLLDMMCKEYPGKTFCVAWGKEGAWGCDSAHKVYHSTAFEPGELVDTLAAGDTFNAAFIHACIQGKTIEETLRDSCMLAGKKCGQQGLSGLV